ncbi:MAG: serine hydrolase [Cyanobacteria bacterium SBC]|nr:serine hydrolase [Cyanobacteria bacterium SBC]
MKSPKYLYLMLAVGIGLGQGTEAIAEIHPQLQITPETIDLSFSRTQEIMTLSTQNCKDRKAEIDTYLQAHHALRRFSGAVAIACDGETVFSQGYGMADLAHQVPNTPQTKFRLGSITKQFTAAAILQLQDRGLLNVQMPVVTYLPDYPNEGVTLHHLLTHTAGIPNLTSFPDYPEWMRLPTTLNDLIARFVDLPLAFEPGEQFSYSNSGYVLLTQTIEVVSGQSYANYLEEHLFEPLGMNDTGYEFPLAIIERLASGYQGTDDGYQEAEYINMDVPQGAGGLYSTVENLMRWNQFLFGDDRDREILSDESVTAMTSPLVLMDSENEPDIFYGYGLIVNQSEQGRIGHGGGINGFVSSLSYLPDRDLTIAILSNVVTADLGRISKDLAAILLGKPYELPTLPDTVAVNPTVYQHYIGTYRLSPEFEIEITVEFDRLYARGTGQPRIALYPSSETEFFAREIELRITFNLGEDNRVESLTLRQNDREIVAPKVQ